MSVQAKDWTLPAQYLVVDLEATCDATWMIPRHEMEIIEIGAVKLDEAFAETDSFQAFVRPVVHPHLTKFCTDLTSITQEEVEAAPGFPDVFGSFLEWVGAPPKWFVTWGDFDRILFKRDCDRHTAVFPQWMFRRHCNLRGMSIRRDGTAPSLETALREKGLSLDGTQHRAIHDARNTAKLVPYILGNASAAEKVVLV